MHGVFGAYVFDRSAVVRGGVQPVSHLVQTPAQSALARLPRMSG